MDWKKTAQVSKSSFSTHVISFAKLSNFKVLPRKPRLVNKKRLGTGKTSPWWTAPSTFRIFNPKLNYKASLSFIVE